jgi:curved DNA-binding protein CbpA
VTDPYAILGLPRTATAEEVDRAFRELSLLHHPDRWGDKARFQELNDAYEILSDPARRASYDTTGLTVAPLSDSEKIVAILCETYTRVLFTILHDPEHPLPSHLNLILKIKDFLTKSICDLSAKRDVPERAITILSAIAGRFTTTGDENLFENLTRDQLSHAQAELARFDADIALLHRAIDALAEYTYRWEKTPGKTMSPFGHPSGFKWLKLPEFMEQVAREMK